MARRAFDSESESGLTSSGTRDESRALQCNKSTVYTGPMGRAFTGQAAFKLTLTESPASLRRLPGHGTGTRHSPLPLSGSRSRRRRRHRLAAADAAAFLASGSQLAAAAAAAVARIAVGACARRGINSIGGLPPRPPPQP